MGLLQGGSGHESHDTLTDKMRDVQANPVPGYLEHPRPGEASKSGR